LVKCVNYIRSRYPLITYLERPRFFLAHLIYRGIKYGQAYVEQGAKAYEQRMRERTVRTVRNRVKIHHINILELNIANVSV